MPTEGLYDFACNECGNWKGEDFIQWYEKIEEHLCEECVETRKFYGEDPGGGDLPNPGDREPRERESREKEGDSQFWSARIAYFSYLLGMPFPSWHRVRFSP